MTEPMWCPMSFNNPEPFRPMECIPDCAWAVNAGNESNPELACGLVYNRWVEPWFFNTRQLEDDVDD